MAPKQSRETTLNVERALVSAGGRYTTRLSVSQAQIFQATRFIYPYFGRNGTCAKKKGLVAHQVLFLALVRVYLLRIGYDQHKDCVCVCVHDDGPL